MSRNEKKAKGKSNSPKITGACASWDFRANKDYYTKFQIVEFLKKYSKRWVFQLEKGEENGYEHWQGRFSLFKKVRKNGLRNIMDMENFAIPNFLIPTITEVHDNKQFNYVLKEQTRIEGPWTDKNINQFDEFKKPDYIPRYLQKFNEDNLYPWQKHILESRKEEYTRKVNLVVDRKGCNGKSTIANYVKFHRLGYCAPPYTECKEIIQAVCDMLMAKQDREPGLLIMDIPRAFDIEKLQGIVAAVEIIKSGSVCDGRNHYKEWDFEPPAIWIFTNNFIENENFAQNRWNVYNLHNGELHDYFKWKNEKNKKPINFFKNDGVEEVEKKVKVKKKVKKVNSDSE